MEQSETVEPRLTRRKQSSRRLTEESNPSRPPRRQSTSSSYTVTGRPRSSSHDINFEDSTGVLSASESSWWDDSPLMVAVLPCLGAFVFGTEYIQDIILFVCVCWYLHTCIHLPWSLYEISRPRKMPPQIESNMTQTQRSAQRALGYRSIALLIFALISPFAGLLFIRTILASVGAYDGGPYVTYFHAALFVLFGGVRPINHLANLIAGGTRELQGRVHHPSPHAVVAEEELEDLKSKMERMEMLVSMLTEKLRDVEHAKEERETRKEKGMLDVQDSFEKTAARLEDGARRREKKVEITMEMMERRLEGLEMTCDTLIGIVRDYEKETMASPVDYPARHTFGLRGLIITLLDWAEAIWLLLTFRRRSRNHNRRRSGSNNGAYGYTAAYGAGGRARKVNLNGNGTSTRINGNSLSMTPLTRRRSYDAPVLNLDTVVEEEAPGVDINADVLHEPGFGDANGVAGITALGGIRRRGGRIVPGALDADSVSTQSQIEI
ncbi:hypothetical protein M408DRAFT_214421 [Serendipita vermifera MAFF 305830]|uniref:Uncharacterized protein n=1 Tax=Serendipita vermifera MAFF 305830 TaxID=933852 RepID=A0A0C2XTD3_SERVB|nr:hypothetical protein M408DRAFT_214421 [Serendipita vermifera MAFF 305830]